MTYDETSLMRCFFNSLGIIYSKCFDLLYCVCCLQILTQWWIQDFQKGGLRSIPFEPHPKIAEPAEFWTWNSGHAQWSRARVLLNQLNSGPAQWSKARILQAFKSFEDPDSRAIIIIIKSFSNGKHLKSPWPWICRRHCLLDFGTKTVIIVP